MKTDDIQRRLKNSLTTGLAYGGGLVAGSIVAQLFFSFVSLQGIENDDLRFMLGLLLVFTIAMFGGGIGGFVGGWTLPTVGGPRGRWGYAWQSALSLGIPYGTVMYLLVFLIYSVVVGDRIDIPPATYAVVFLILGSVLGLVVGLMLGIVTVGRRFLRVALAGLLGFGLGGVGFGLAYRAFLYTIPRGELAQEGSYILVLLGLFLFGLGGGAAFGYVYDVLAHAVPRDERKAPSRRVKIIRWGLAAVVLLLVVVWLWPLLLDLGDVLMPRSANLSHILDTDAVGTHWSHQTGFPSQQNSDARHPALAVYERGLVAMAWTESVGDATSLLFASGAWAEEGDGVRWGMPATISTPGARTPAHPQIAFDPSGVAHVLWLEGAGAGQSAVAYTRCAGTACSEPTLISDQPGSACGATVPEGQTGSAGAPAIAVDGTGAVLAVWETPGGSLEFASWNADEASPSPTPGCVPAAGADLRRQPRLAADLDGTHSLIFNQGAGPDGDIMILGFVQGEWQSSTQVIGTGSMPEIWIDPEAGTHAAWCDGDAAVRYWDGTSSEAVADVACAGRPELGLDNHGRIHVVFFSGELESGSGLSSRETLYETIRDDGRWAAPMIVALPELETQPALASSSDGILHLAWSERGTEREALAYAFQRQYDCDGVQVSGLVQAALQVAEGRQYRSPDSIIAYCQNRYDRLVFTPNPSSEFSEQAPTPNGAFDQLASLAASANYEVLLATMAYEGAEKGSGPGIVVGEAIVGLYNELKSDPAHYPRGLTVRILLGNSPPFTTLELDSQLWLVLEDLREAGVETMVDPELGWRLEVANFEGAFPHSHSKLMVVDGKTVITNGFNMEFRPLPQDHPSGRGKGDTDLGIQVTGPVAQDARRVFDDLWDGAVQRHCTDFYPAYWVWQATCRDQAATVDHVPEVMRYYVTGGDAIALSMFRSIAHDEADQGVYAIVTGAKDSIDILHVSFSWPLLCNLNHFYNLCTFDQAPPYMERLVDAIENSEAQVRILVGVLPFQGIENVVAVHLLRAELEERGLGDRVEIRFFDGLLHAKTILVDDQFLIVGSQNLHYSAFGKNDGLAEYSLGVEDPQAVSDYKRLFDYHWQRAEP